MAEGKDSPEAWAILDEMRGCIQTLEPATDSQKLIYDYELQWVHELADAREERLLQANVGLPTILGAVLLIRGVTLVGFTYLFDLQSTLVHTLMVAALALPSPWCSSR